MTDPMVAFVLARLDEDAAPVPVPAWHEYWCHNPFVHAGEDACVDCGATEEPGNIQLVRRSARTLREIEVKRRIVEKHGPTPRGYTWVGDDDDLMPACRVCGDLTVAFPCPTLRLLTSVYDDHADYLPEWKP